MKLTWLFNQSIKVVVYWIRNIPSDKDAEGIYSKSEEIIKVYLINQKDVLF